MRKLLLASIFVFTLLFVAPVTVLAASVLNSSCKDYASLSNDDPNKPTICKDNTPQDQGSNSIYGPNGILTKAASIISIAVGAVCVIVIIIGGIRYALSGGDTQQTANAKNTILYAIVGLVITLSARAIILFVMGRI